MARQPVIGVQEVRRHQRRRREIFTDHGANKGARLLLQTLHQVIIKPVFRVQADVWIVPPHLPQIEPIVCEVLNEPLKGFAGNQPLAFRAQHAPIPQQPFPRTRSEHLVRARVG